MGSAYGYLNTVLYGGDDTWNYHQLSQIETTGLCNDPYLFFKNLFRLEHYVQNYQMTQAWESVQYGAFIKLLAILNLFSGGAYYVNVVLFNMISFWGAYHFYQFFKTAFHTDGFVLQAVIFFFLPVVFWTSGIRKDGLIFLSIGLFLHYFNRYLLHGNRHNLLVCIVALLVLSLNRSLLVLTLLPASLAWFLSVKTKWRPSVLQILITTVLTLLCLMLPFHILDTLIQKNHAFHLLTGGSRVDLPILQPTFKSFVSAFPKALSNVFLKPLPFNIHRPFAFVSGIETLIVLFFSFLAILFSRSFEHAPSIRSTIWALISICLINYLLIGFIVPFVGAIIRYRIVFEFILLTTSLLCIDWAKIKRYIFK